LGAGGLPAVGEAGPPRRRGGLGPLAVERAVGHGDVDRGRGGRGERHGRSPQLPLERAHVVHLLYERRGAERLLVEDLEADAAPARDPGGGERDAELVDLVLGDRYGGGAGVV